MIKKSVLNKCNIYIQANWHYNEDNAAARSCKCAKVPCTASTVLLCQFCQYTKNTLQQSALVRSSLLRDLRVIHELAMWFELNQELHHFMFLLVLLPIM